MVLDQVVGRLLFDLFHFESALVGVLVQTAVVVQIVQIVVDERLRWFEGSSLSWSDARFRRATVEPSLVFLSVVRTRVFVDKSRVMQHVLML